ncbi:glycosyltransferase family 2 protein [Raineya orbicola]|jgi:glycosyltransferase involved in cell wall biosynthesis|uniref:Glycosyl transferase family 2 n=1 Tax=Raineya orbicola TaxID=2016530 RepID=A0A2N3IHV4_9BACT|nr:glycosyltransferase family 2 protein [Raineya orbicola]PKQ69909.1 Glycosyl transferase family 2 [Raineya orbicola]
MKLSVVIITFNEEQNIQRCLESVQAVADEIVVVDSFSTDKTAEICQKYQVQFIQQAFLGYVEQKNFANAQASYDWILSLDADEALSERLKNEILQLKKQENPNADAFSMPRLTNYLGKWIRHTDWYPDRRIRLFNKTKAHWTGINPHDCIQMQNANSLVSKLKGDILHYSYYSIHQHIAQLNHFTSIMAETLVKSGKKAPLYKLFINPIWKFLYSYVLRLGFLDGYYGFVVCAVSAFATFTKYLKIRELSKKSKKN